MFHRVGPAPLRAPAVTDALTVSHAAFVADVEWMKRAGFHAVTLRQVYAALEHGAPLPSHPVVITFDDGYRDVLWYAAPVLHRLHMPATAFVITGRIDDGDPSFLSWPELRRLERLGVAIGSHTVHHLDLTTLPPQQDWTELVQSRRTLQRRLHQPVLFFAYPGGRADAAVVALVRRAGYELALTTRHGALQSSSQPLLLHRDGIYDWTGLNGLKGLLGWRFHGPVRARAGRAEVAARLGGCAGVQRPQPGARRPA